MRGITVCSDGEELLQKSLSRKNPQKLNYKEIEIISFITKFIYFMIGFRLNERR